ncbi:MAG: hypothetical protein JW797_15155 [Bradymonadales bacterium]|nr:hypothetical protein [Bradymonadales bacterium]
MKLSEITRALELVNLTPELEATTSEREITLGHVSDLLSDVLGYAPAGGVLVTIQVHLNVIAVAVHSDLAAVIFASDRVPEETVLERSIQEGLPLYSSNRSAFEIVGRLYEMGLRGREE